MLKTLFVNSAKLAVAVALIYWLISSGKLDFSLLGSLGEHPLAVAAAALLSVFNFFLISIRWKSILRSRSSVRIPNLGLLKTTWIGQFFSSVLPGSVSGDLVKIFYIQKYDEAFSKKFVFATILIDRVMGLCGLILLVGLSSLLFGNHIRSNAPAMGTLLNFNYFLSCAVILGFGIFFFFHDRFRVLLTFFQGKFASGLFQKLISLWDDLVSIKSKMLRAIGLSIIVQFIGVLIFWSLIQPFVDGKMDFIQALAFIPLGLMTLALPVAPSGLGVGHAIFQKLFEFSGITNGASLFNLYFFVTLAVNVLGVIPYVLTSRKQKSS